MLQFQYHEGVINAVCVPQPAYTCLLEAEALLRKYRPRCQAAVSKGSIVTLKPSLSNLLM